MKRECGFDKTGDSGRLFWMPDIRLDRADGAVLFASSLLSKSHGQRFNFERIANKCAGCVAFDVADAICAYPGRFQRVSHRLGLLAQTRRGIAVFR